MILLHLIRPSEVIFWPRLPRVSASLTESNWAGVVNCPHICRGSDDFHRCITSAYHCLLGWVTSIFRYFEGSNPFGGLIGMTVVRSRVWFSSRTSAYFSAGSIVVWSGGVCDSGHVDNYIFSASTTSAPTRCVALQGRLLIVFHIVHLLSSRCTDG